MKDLQERDKNRQIYENELERLAKDKNVSATNKAEIREYAEYCLAEGIRTRAKNASVISRLRKVLTWIPGNEDLWLAKRDDFKTVLDGLFLDALQDSKGKTYSPWTKKAFADSIRAYMRYRAAGKTKPAKDMKNPEQIQGLSWSRFMNKKNKFVSPNVLLAEETIKKTKAVSNVREQAAIAYWYYNALRNSEVCATNVGDINLTHPNGYYTYLVREGKTGSRGPFRTQEGKQELVRWLNEHPMRNLPREEFECAPLFVCRTKNVDGRVTWRRMELEDFSCMFDKLRRRAGLSDTIDLSGRNLRRTRITEWKRLGISDQSIRKRIGHVDDSVALAAYARFSNEAVDEEFAKKLGGTYAPPKRDERPVMCPSCSCSLGAMDRYCPACHLPITPDAIKEATNQMTAMQENMAKMQSQFAALTAAVAQMQDDRLPEIKAWNEMKAKTGDEF